MLFKLPHSLPGCTNMNTGTASTDTIIGFAALGRGIFHYDPQTQASLDSSSSDDFNVQRRLEPSPPTEIADEHPRYVRFNTTVASID